MAQLTGSAAQLLAPASPEQAGSYHAAEEIVQFSCSEGEDQSLPSNQISEGACRSMQNMYYPREARNPRTRPGVTQHQAGTAAAGAITAAHCFQVDDNTSFIVFAALNALGTDQELYYLNASREKVALAASLGSTVPPTMITFGGELLVAVPGQYLRVWLGQETGVGDTPARATATITVADYTLIADGETFTIGTYTFTFKTAREQSFEVTIGASNNATATNLAAAVNQDISEVKAATGAGGSANVVTLTVRKTGAAGNATALAETTGGGVTKSGATFSGGEDGAQLDTIDTYAAPKPGIIASDKNLRVLASGDTTSGSEDLLFFSEPGDAWRWARTPDGDGKIYPIGNLEGNYFTAICPRLDEIFVHKGGQNKEVYRVTILDPDDASWTIQRRFFAGATAALNQRSAVSVAGKHLAVDSGWFRVFSGDDTYDEIASGMDGQKVLDRFVGASATGAFIVVNPLELYALVFPNAGSLCLCYHYGTGRWTHWIFAGGLTFSSGAWSEELGTILLGGQDGLVYKLDADSALDGEASYQSIVIGRTLDGGTRKLLAKFTLLDYQHIAAGDGKVEFVPNRLEADPKTVLDRFEIEDAGLALADATMPLYEATFPFSTEEFRRVFSTQQASGETLAPKITVNSGRIAINNLIVKIATFGRASA